MANVNWLKDNGNTSVDFLERGLSDHSPSLVSVAKYVSYRPKPFKFFNFWVKHAQFLDWVDEGWKIEVTGYAMFRLYYRLNLLKIFSRSKNLEVFGGLSQKVVQARQNLAIAQSEFLSSGGSIACQRKERECLHHFISISNAKENFLKQKSRNRWLNLGDGNNSFFHNSVKIRNSSNLIKQLKDEKANCFYDFQQIKELAIEFNQKLIGSPMCSLKIRLIGYLGLSRRSFLQLAFWG